MEKRILNYNEYLLEKSTSKSQQRLFGMLLAYKKGLLKPNKSLKKKLDKMSDIDLSDIEDFAKTKHKNLPEKKDK